MEQKLTTTIETDEPKDMTGVEETIPALGEGDPAPEPETLQE